MSKPVYKNAAFWILILLSVCMMLLLFTGIHLICKQNHRNDTPENAGDEGLLSEKTGVAMAQDGGYTDGCFCGAGKA